MTAPRPPSITTTITGDPLTPRHHSDAHLFLVGPPGTGASGDGLPVTGPGAERPSDYATGLAGLEDFIGTDGPLHTAVEAIFDRLDTNIAVALTPAGATHAQVVSTLEKARFLEDAPTHLYAPGLTVLGDTLGDLAADIVAAGGSVELAADAVHTVEVDEYLQIEDEIVRVTAVTDQQNFTVERGELGTSAADHASGVDVLDIRSPVCTELESLGEELECLAVADAPSLSEELAVEWANAGNVRPNVMGVFNKTDNEWPGAAWLAAALDVAAEHGRQRGIELARVTGVTNLQYELSYSPRETVDTDVSRLVGAYLSTLVRRRGHVQIVGDSLKGVADARRFWSVALVVHHSQRIAELAKEPFIGVGATPSTVTRVASHVERAVRQLVPRELRFASVIPHPVYNTAEARANGDVELEGIFGTISPARTIRTRIRLAIGEA